jgi:hypothetical protein
MKKIFWTTVFRVVVVFLFRAYLRVLDHPLGLTIGSRFGKNVPVCVTTSGAGAQLSGLDNQLTTIQQQLSDLTQKISSVSLSSSVTPVTPSFATTASTNIVLYYFNQKEDAKLPPEQQLNVSSLQSVSRTLPATDNILRDTINLLIQGNLSATEKDA